MFRSAGHGNRGSKLPASYQPQPLYEMASQQRSQTAQGSQMPARHRSGGGCPRRLAFRRRRPVCQSGRVRGKASPDGGAHATRLPSRTAARRSDREHTAAAPKGSGRRSRRKGAQPTPGPKWPHRRGHSGGADGPQGRRGPAGPGAPSLGAPLYKIGALVKRPHHRGCAAHEGEKPAPRHTPSGAPLHRGPTARRGQPRFQPQPGRTGRRTPQPDGHRTAAVTAA